MKLNRLVVCALVVGMMTGTCYGAEAITEGSTEAVENISEASTEALEDLTEAETEAETEEGVKLLLKDVKWDEFKIAIGGKVEEFPRSASTLADDGWAIELAYKGVDLEPYNYIEVQAKNGDHIAYFYIANLTDKTIKAEEATVVGIRVTDAKWGLDSDTGIELPGGIRRGVSTEADVAEVYTDPSGTSEVNGVTTYSYIANEYERYDVDIDKSGVVNGFKMLNFTIPDGVEAQEVKPDPTDAVKAYKAPETLSDSIKDFEVQIGDMVVTVPVPVSYFTSNGWELVDGEGSVGSYNEAWITLKKGDVSIDTIAVNVEEGEQSVENCWIDSIDFGVDYNSDFVISGGIKIGDTKEDVLNAIAEAGIEFTESEIGDYSYIEYNTDDLQTGVLLSIYSSDAGEYEKDTVTYICVYNSYKGAPEEQAETIVSDETESEATTENAQ